MTDHESAETSKLTGPEDGSQQKKCVEAFSGGYLIETLDIAKVNRKYRKYYLVELILV